MEPESRPRPGGSISDANYYANPNANLDANLGAFYIGLLDILTSLSVGLAKIAESTSNIEGALIVAADEADRVEIALLKSLLRELYDYSTPFGSNAENSAHADKIYGAVEEVLGINNSVELDD